MSEQKHFVASDATVGQNHKPNRKEPKQISFRVSESEYLKLKQSAETLNMSVPNFVKKKAQGSRLVAPKLDKTTRQSIAKDLSKLGSNANQIAKYCNQHQYDAPNYEALEHGFERQIQRRQQQERESDTDFQPKRPTSNRDEPTERDTGVTQSDWDKFAQDTNELERRRQAAESARLADEKARRDREERERAKQASRTIIDNDRDHGLEL